MNFSLDYDGTYDADPEFWLQFVKDAQKNGDNVYVVTERSLDESEDIDPELVKLCHVIACNGAAKKDVTEQLGIDIDIWIDNKPKRIYKSKDE